MKSEHEAVFVQLKNHLIERARAVSAYGYSYRNFLVGCAVLAWRNIPDLPEIERYNIFTAANLKPVEGGPKFCAEATAINYARSNGFTKIVAIVVAGMPQVDESSGITPPTLHPCGVCRTLLGSLPEIGSDTYVVTVHNHSGIVEEMSVKELLSLHDSKAG